MSLTLHSKINRWKREKMGPQDIYFVTTHQGKVSVGSHSRHCNPFHSSPGLSAFHLFPSKSQKLCKLQFMTKVFPTTKSNIHYSNMKDVEVEIPQNRNNSNFEARLIAMVL